MFIRESTRPASISKAITDLEDIRVILVWLKERELLIDFAAYPEKPKEELLPGFHAMYRKGAEFRTLLHATMVEEDLALVRN
jgi:hypothetical protein